jgi:copper oxidase (laccase) domain-containing protein
MVTNLKNIELQVRVADCGNIYAYDYVAEVI